MERIEAVLAVVANTAEILLTSRDVANAVGIDYRRNFNKREARYGRKLAGFITRRRLTNEEFAQRPDARKVLYWLLDDRWRGMPVADVLAAFREGHS